MSNEIKTINCNDAAASYRKMKDNWLTGGEIERLKNLGGLDPEGIVACKKEEGNEDRYLVGIGVKAASDLGTSGVAKLLGSCADAFSDRPEVCESLSTAVVTPVSCKDAQMVDGASFTVGEVVDLWKGLKLGPDRLFFNADSGIAENSGDICIDIGRNSETLKAKEKILEEQCPLKSEGGQEKCDAIRTALEGVNEGDHWSAGWAFAVSGAIVGLFVAIGGAVLKILGAKFKGKPDSSGDDPGKNSGGGSLAGDIAKASAPGKSVSAQEAQDVLRGSLELGALQFVTGANPTAGGVTVTPVLLPQPVPVLVPAY